jgi:DNA gyrase subunit B
VSFAKYIGFRHKKTKKLPLYLVKVEGQDHFLYNDDELARYIKIEEEEVPRPEKRTDKDNDKGKNGRKGGKDKANEKAEAQPKPKEPPQEMTKGPEYIEFYEARETEKIIERIEKLGVDIEDYDIEEDILETKKAKEAARAEPKPRYVIKAEKVKHQFASLKEILKFVMSSGKEGMSIQRYKGLGEMNPQQLWETTMDPEKRTLLKVALEDAVEAESMFTTLMGDQVEPRREFIEKHAHEVKVLDI